LSVPHFDIQQHPVDAPALTEPGPEAETGGVIHTVMESGIIVLDKPTTGQNQGHLNKFLARMKMLNEAGKTIILISHDIGVIGEYASRTIMMKEGRY